MNWQISRKVGGTMQVVDRILSFGSRWAVQNSTASLEAPRDPTQPSRLTRRDYALKPRREESPEHDKSSAPEAQRLNPGAARLRQQCLKLAHTLFAGASQARSLGFISAVAGEGKTFLARETAAALASQANQPVVLVDCNWEHPTLHELYELAEGPGLAEWARGECDLAAIRHLVAPNLTIITAGRADNDGVSLASRLAAHGINSVLTEATEVLIADLPPVLDSAYGAQLAQELDAVALVVRAGATWDSFVAEACHELENAQVAGIILNAAKSRIPRWLQRLL